MEFLLSTFNGWVWFIFGGLSGVLLLLAYYSHGSKVYYEPDVYGRKDDLKTIHVDSRFRGIDFKQIDGEWYPKINLRERTITEAIIIIVLIALPCMLIVSYKINQIDHFAPNGEVVYKAKN